MPNYTTIIGLEIHVELQTKSKMFCQCSADYFDKKPNSEVCPVCLGMPGALPVPNRKAIEYCQMIGLALGCKLSRISKFDRKHYFYPDLPKGYQISQYDQPLCTGGKISIYNPTTGKESEHRITRVHMEEDTGKLLHRVEESLIDFNRSGVPLVEIVTEPDFENAEDVKAFLKELQTIIRELKVSNADMEKGSMRLEPNISLRLTSETELPNYKVEVKNINSFNFVKKAIEYEVKRQAALLERGERPRQETRGFNENKGITFSQRSKEYAHDYRYFPEPDIPPMEFESKYLHELMNKLPKLPKQKWLDYIKLGLKEKEAFQIAYDKNLQEKFDQLRKFGDLQDTVNVVINRKSLSLKDMKKVIEDKKKPLVIHETKLVESINKVIDKNKKAVEDYKGGKESALMFLLGQSMRELKGKAEVETVRQKLLEKLKKI